jgi:hypothetical protein
LGSISWSFFPNTLINIDASFKVEVNGEIS